MPGRADPSAKSEAGRREKKRIRKRRRRKQKFTAGEYATFSESRTEFWSIWRSIRIALWKLQRRKEISQKAEQIVNFPMIGIFYACVPRALSNFVRELQKGSFFRNWYVTISPTCEYNQFPLTKPPLHALFSSTLLFLWNSCRG
jgi:hypothetical protein